MGIISYIYFGIYNRFRKLIIDLVFKFFYFFVLIETSLFFEIKKSNVKKPRIIFGTTPLLNYKYWKESVVCEGFKATTLMSSYFHFINKKDDFDSYLDEYRLSLTIRVIQKITFFFLKTNVYRDLYILRRIAIDYDIIDCTCDGFLLGRYRFWSKEALIFKKYNCKIVVNPYGGDMYMYSKLKDPCVLHGFMMSYPKNADKEEEIERKVRYWSKNADCFKPNLAIDGINKWSVLPYNTLAINTNEWVAKNKYSERNGENGIVVVAHCPNHRGIKGTEFIVKAVDELKKEGLKVKLLLLEKLQNLEVKRILLEEVDILVEQLVLCAYALSGVEGMVTGIPVISNLDIEESTRLFRRYSYLNECPILSSKPETIKQNLKILITNPQLRKDLGQSGRLYVEKYHSYSATGILFTKIYDKIWYNKEVDLMNMYNPLNPDSYNNQSPLINHPLFENKIPEELMKKLNK